MELVMPKMTNEQQMLLSLLANALFNKPLAPLPDINWEKVREEAKAQSVIPIVFRVAGKKQLPEETEEAWSRDSAAGIAKNMRVNHDHGLVNQWLSEAGIPYVILKGLVSAASYPMPILRSMGDVDFLVPNECVSSARKLLEDNGLRQKGRMGFDHIAFVGKGMHLEMHFQVPGIPDGKQGELVRSYIKDIFERSSTQEIAGETVMVPSPFHHGLILLLHTCHHLTAEGIGLRHLCDWAVFENQLSDDNFCELFEDKLKAVGLWKFAQALTQVCIRYLGADRKIWVDSDESELVDGLIEDIFSSGNFGRKEEERGNQGLLISTKGRNGVGRTGVLRQFVLSINNRLNIRWPLTRNNRFFLAVGWIIYAFHCARLAITGKKEVPKVDKMVHGAKQRRDLYRDLKLFES